MTELPFTLHFSEVPQRDESTDLTVIIAHRGPAIGLWATIESCEIQLDGTGLKHNYVIVFNGERHYDVELVSIKKHLDASGRLLDFIHHDRPLSPPSARQMGSEIADGEYLFFFDNHCLAGPDYFRRAIATMKKHNMDMLHSTTKFYLGEKDHFHYKLTLRKNFWGESSFESCNVDQPYRIAAGGHGGFVVKRSVWEEVGGYGPVLLFDGYGGEELYFDLKMAMYDKTVWIDPKVTHTHWSGHRPYSRHLTDGYFRCLMQCAYMIGGQAWVDRVFTRFRFHPKTQGKSMYDLYVEAIQRGNKQRQEIEAKAKRSFDEQLQYFVDHNIAH